jgi:hypothetical protein
MTVTKHGWRFWGFVLCLAVLLWLPSLNAAGIQIITSLGYNGYVIPEHWVPLQIQLKGINESSTRIEIIREENDHGEDSLKNGSFDPALIERFTIGSVNQVEIPVFAAENIKSIKVRVLAGNQLLSEQILDMKAKVFPGHLVLTANIPAVDNQAIERTLLPVEPVKAVAMDIHQLPNLGLDYDGVSCLIINNPELVFTPAQLKALRYWLAGGGQLLVLGTDQDVIKLLPALGVQTGGSVKELASIPIGFGHITIIRNHLTDNLPGGNIGFWRKWLELKPFHETTRFTTTGSFFNEPWVREDQTATYPFPTMAVFFSIWALAALVIIWRRSKNLLVSILVFTLVATGLMIPTAGYLTAKWRRGALIHNRAIILPGSGGMLLHSEIIVKPTRGASPWGASVNLGGDEKGRINFPGRHETVWNHNTVYPWYSLYHWDGTSMQWMGVFPDVMLDFKPVQSLVGNPGPWIIPVTGQTALWNGKQWRVFKISANGEPRWVPQKSVPAWFRDDEEWLGKLQTLSPGISWLCGRSVLPARLQLKIQNGAVSEVFWVMPYLKPVSAGGRFEG